MTAAGGPIPVPGSLAAGRLIADRYKLERRIAVGGMGEVWEALDERLGRNVAVKVLRGELSDDDEFLHRFRIEARTVASLNHSGVASIHDYGEDEVTEDGRRTAYLVMELVRGEPLSAVIARGPMEPAETLRIMEQAAHSLYAAHERGFVHRDVKPGNILIRVDGTVKLTDFGIAKAANAVPVTRTGMVMGTAHYIAPEQASGGEAGPEGDVYSLGIVGYECLAGHRPFRADNAVAVAMMQVRDEPPPLPESVPWRVRQLIETILVKDPDRRYADGAELAAAVAAVRRDEALPTPARMTAQGLRLPSAESDGADPGTDTPTSHRRRSKRERRATRGRDRSRAGSSSSAATSSGEVSSDGVASGGLSATGSSTGSPAAGVSSAPSLPPVSPTSSPSAGARRATEQAGSADRDGSGPGRDRSRPSPERSTPDRNTPGRGSSDRSTSDRSTSDRSARDRAAVDGRPAPGAAASGPQALRSPARGATPARPSPTPTSAGGAARTATPGPTPTPTPTPGGSARPATGPSTPGAASRTPPPRPPVAPAPPTEPLKLVARQQSQRSGTVLLVAFVLLIVAAVVVAALMVPKLFADAAAPSTGLPPNGTHADTSTGSVSAQVAALARPAAPAGPAGSAAAPTRTEEVR
ncbi:protein kinase domain-containing protein [Pseudonocardia halophobica]|uniref:serine/threonine-protein kinase n=1 Tax=Pseudonocardia halophobica TaxID=29401 RepID=UPI003D91A7B1